MIGFYTGFHLDVAIMRGEICAFCNGTGASQTAQILTCHTCKSVRPHARTHARTLAHSLARSLPHSLNRSCKSVPPLGPRRHPAASLHLLPLLPPFTSFPSCLPSTPSPPASLHLLPFLPPFTSLRSCLP